jgi:hypothetical protein
MQRLKAEPPCWGGRSIWASLRLIAPLAVHKQRLLRLLRAHHLLVPANLRRKATRAPGQGNPRPTTPHEWWGIDMTPVLVDGWGYVGLGLDW